MGNSIKKIGLLGILCIGVIGFTGCGTVKIPSSVSGMIVSELNGRRQANMSCADALLNAGLITQVQYDDIDKATSGCVDSFRVGLDPTGSGVMDYEEQENGETGSGELSDQDAYELGTLEGKKAVAIDFLSAISDWAYVPQEVWHITYDNEHKEVISKEYKGDYSANGEMDDHSKWNGDVWVSKPNASGFNTQYLTNWMTGTLYDNTTPFKEKKYLQKQSEITNKMVSDYVPCFSGNGKIKPIQMVPKSMDDVINNIMSSEVYVLKAPANGEVVELDEVVDAVNAASKFAGDSSIKDTNKAVSTLLKYFEPAKDLSAKAKNGEYPNMTLMDMADYRLNILRDSIAVNTSMEWLDENCAPIIGNEEDEKASLLRENADDILKFGINKAIRNPVSGKNLYWEGDIGGIIGSSTPPVTKFAHNDKSEYNVVGHDLVITANGQSGEHPYLSIRFHEFNKEAVDKVIATLGNNRYLKVGKRVFLMEYPVGYVDGFEKYTSDNVESFKTSIKPSVMTFNLKTQRFNESNMQKFIGDGNGDGVNIGGIITASRFDGEDTRKYASNEMVDYTNEGSFLPVRGGTPETEWKSSIVIYGQTGSNKAETNGDKYNVENDDSATDTNWNLYMGINIGDGTTGNKRYTTMGRLVLRDYLEAIYAPDVYEGENIVVMGRRLRIKSFGGKNDSTSAVALYYDMNGNELKYGQTRSPELHLSDFADIEELSKDRWKYIKPNGMEDLIEENGADGSGGENTEEEYSNSEENSIDGNGINESDKIKASADLINKIPKDNTATSIKVSDKFPGKILGKVDNREYSPASPSEKVRPVFYAMAVSKSMFQTGLYSNWILPDTPETESLVWWNNWLSANDFNYEINSNLLTDFLAGNYDLDMWKDGSIDLDLDTINKIKHDFEKQDMKDTVAWIRAIFVVFGFLLIGYGLVLLAAWNLDTNLDIGIDLTGKLTFGHWVAIKSPDETPYIESDKVKYVGIKQVGVSVFVIMFIGVLFIVVDVVSVVVLLIEAFGTLIDFVKNMITGGTR